MTTLSWGILGTGAIASTFAKHLPRSRTGKLVAVGSRTQAKADAFIAERTLTGVRAHGSYEALLADPAVQAVYVSTPHPEHAQWAIKAAQAGKHLLVEKPIGMNAAEAMAMVDAAQVADVFLLEAFMYRCHPQTAKLVELIRAGAIGKVRIIQATFGFHWPNPWNAQTRLLDPALGGGGILDVGCYPMSMARLIAGAALGKPFMDPSEVKGHGFLGASGVDEWTVATALFPEGIVAQLSTSVQVNQDNVVRIYGSEGSIVVPAPWITAVDGGASEIVVHHHKTGEQRISVTTDRPLYAIEADTVCENLAARQAPAMPWEDTLGQARSLDKWRQAIGLVYPPEQEPNFPPPLLRRTPRAQTGAPIPRVAVPGVDIPVSKLAMGLVWDPAQAAVLFDEFFEQGGNCFDTSWWYGQGYTDKILGRWMASRGVRKDTVIIAKGAHTPGCYPEELTRQLLISLECLRTDRADIYFMHRDNEQIPVGEFVEVLNEHHRKGRIGVFGGSNWSLARIQAFNEYAKQKGLKGMGGVSNNFSLARMVNPVWAGCIAATEPAFRAWFEQTRTPLFAWSSQARGFFVRGKPDFLADQELTNAWYSADNFERLERARQLAAKKGVNANNIALAYVLAQRFPLFCLIGPATLGELRTTLPALSVSLSPEEMRWLNLEDGAKASAS
ncbi:MAG: aldo/keto reductase [Planctomycetes bacterium]|nr:aldo/keto reductase [Planctomycetota bacterium]